jgi:hypothetical protein
MNLNQSNPFQETANKNQKQAKYWSIARLILGIILILTILFI